MFITCMEEEKKAGTDGLTCNTSGGHVYQSTVGDKQSIEQLFRFGVCSKVNGSENTEMQMVKNSAERQHCLIMNTLF